jgi:hypothetical protein
MMFIVADEQLCYRGEFAPSVEKMGAGYRRSPQKAQMLIGQNDITPSLRTTIP